MPISKALSTALIDGTGAITPANVTVSTNNLTVGSSLYVISNGNVGVGTNQPVTPLHVYGNALLRGTSINSQTDPSVSGMWVSFDSGNNLSVLQAINPSSAGFAFHTKSGAGVAAAETLRMTSGLLTVNGSISAQGNSQLIVGNITSSLSSIGAYSNNNQAIYAVANNSVGVQGMCITTGYGVSGIANGAGCGVYALAQSTGPSFVSANSTAETARIAANGNVGFGTATPSSKLHISSASRTYMTITANSKDWLIDHRGTFDTNSNALAFTYDGTEKMRLATTGNLSLATRNSATAGQQMFTIGAFGFRHNDTGGSNYLYLERDYGGWISTPVMTVQASTGGVSIGSVAPQSGYTFTSGASSQRFFGLDSNGIVWARFDDNSLNFPLNLRNLQMTATGHGTGINFQLSRDGTNAYPAAQIQVYSADVYSATDSTKDAGMKLVTTLDGNLTQRINFQHDGEINFGSQNFSSPASANFPGMTLSPQFQLQISIDNNPPLELNRKTGDGAIVNIRQDGVAEGTISVSGTTVTYAAFTGSHWSQLHDGSKPEILRGTVLESIDELCEWPDEEPTERLCKVKISDTVGSKRVYGVFMDWDNDWEITNDMMVTSLGAFVCRVNKDVEVQIGDLLESNGDGTARVQTDDIIRSSTIGKVTGTTKTHIHSDGSYCVPTVLYCG